MNRSRLVPYLRATFTVVRVVVGGGDKEGGAAGSNIMEGLLTLLLSDKLNLSVSGESAGKDRSREADKLRSEIRQSLSEKRVEPGSEPKPPEAKA